MGKDSYFCRMKNKLFHFLETTDSTNLRLKEMLFDKKLSGNDLPQFFTIYTSAQTSGRGQGSTQWESSYGQNMLASIFFKTPLLATEQFAFNQYFSLTIQQLLAQYLPEVTIKWPNDIYINNRKIAGILIEHFIEGEKIKATIAGLGLNVNQEHFSASIPNPTSLKLEIGKSFDVRKLLQDFLLMLKKDFFLLENKNIEYLNQKYLKNLYLFQKEHFFLINGQQTKRTIVGVNSFGQLLLQDENERIESFGHKEVVFL